MPLQKTLISQALYDKNEQIHCENLLGATIIPLGLAGPLQVKSSKFKVQSYKIPLATTEGALVASVNRGCKAINLSGGATTAVELVGTTRGPVFETLGINQSLEFKKWLSLNIDFLKKIAEKTSSHLKLLKYETQINGYLVYVRFYFDTGEAMGMNMVTLATDAIIEAVTAKTNVKCLSISGNFCVDKKASWMNFILGRGRKVWAEVVLKKEVVKKILKIDTQKLFDVWSTKCMIGSALTGSMGFNAHFANVVSAFFAATGQDMAHVVEGSIGITSMKLLQKDDLYVSVYLPDVMIGMVGGGTKLKIKKEALSIIGAKNTDELAQILGGAVLAGEISLLASLGEGSLARAHERLGR